MRWATFRMPGTDEDRVGVVDGDEVHAVEPGVRLVDLLGDLAGAAARAGAETFPLAKVRLRAPIPDPPTVRDFYAFEQHVRTARARRGLEMDPDWYELPVFYFSNPYAVNGPDDPVSAPPGSKELDFELEIAAVAGHDATVAGYTVMNDWSARDLQRREMKLSMGPVKGKDFATTLGPWLVTPDELAPYRTETGYDLAMTATVNGVEYSRARWSDVHFGFEQMIEYAARGTRVAPGDVLGSGTCGTGCILELSLVHGEEAYPWLKPGDEVLLEVEGIGRLRNVVSA